MTRLPDSFWPSAEVAEDAFLLAGLDGWFVISYLIGLVVLMWVSWQRLFNEYYAPVDESSEKVLHLMPPGDLRGTLTMVRAFAIYSLLIGAVYTFLSFAGAFIWKLIVLFGVGDIVGGADVTPPFEMESPAWPLGVSLAFVGIFNHVPKLDVIELTFRRWAHSAIGIPPFIQRRTREVLSVRLLDDPEVHPLNARAHQNERVSRIVASILGDGAADDLLRHLDRLTVLDELVLDEQAAWPGQKVKTRFAPILRALQHDLVDLFDDVDGAAHLLHDLPAGDDRDAAAPQHTQARRICRALTDKARAVHRDLCAVIAVFMENEPAVPADAPAPLRRFIERISESGRSETGATDRVLTILGACAVVVLTATWAAIGTGIGAGYGQLNVMLSALLQSLLVLLTVLPALLVGLALQHGRARAGRWRAWAQGRSGAYPLSQYLGVFVWSFGLTLILVLPFYLAVLMMITPDLETAIDNFRRFFAGYLFLAGLGGVQGVFAAYAAGEVQDHGARRVWKVPLLHFTIASVVAAGLYLTLFHVFGYDGAWLAVRANLFDILRGATVAALATFLLLQMRQAEESFAGAPLPDAAPDLARGAET